MTKFAHYWLGADECIEMYSYMHPRGELNELIWILETSREHRLVRGFAAQVNAAIRDGYDVYENGNSEVVYWTVQTLFSLVEEIAAAKGCVFMMHPDLPGEAFMMTQAYYDKEFADA